MDLGTSLGFIREWGPFVGPALALLAFFLWKDFRREVQLQKRITSLEKEQKEVLFPLIERCVEVIAQNTLVMQRLEKVIGRCTAVARCDQKNLLDRLIENSHDDPA